MSPSPTAAVRFASGLGPPSAGGAATRRSGQRGDETAPAVELSTSEIEMRFCTWSRCGGSFAPSSYHAAFTKPGLTAMPLTAATSGLLLRHEEAERVIVQRPAILRED